MILTKSDTAQWADKLEDFAPEFTPVKCYSVIEFFWLKGRTTSMTISNLECIPDLHYTMYSPNEQRYYYREYRGYDLDTLYFYRPTLTFSGEDVGVNNLRRYVRDGNLWLLFTQGQVENIIKILLRLWKAQFVDEGKVPYRLYVELLKSSIDLEDFRDYGKEFTGFRTVCAQYEKRIRELWDKTREKT